ncbi:MAG: type II toxin-antitoxin system VapC family toxin [Pyrinomonadaceae bacterium]
MSILLDTHVLIWAVAESPRLKPSVIALLNDPKEKVFLSSVTALEIAVKWSLGKLQLPKPPYELIEEFLATSGISQLAVTIRDACAVGDLPFHHKDPFDRLLVAQARTNGLRLMTADPILEKYDVDVIALWLDEDDE